MAKNFSAGWNDPPKLDYSLLNGTNVGVNRDLFSKRVAFPLHTNANSNDYAHQTHQATNFISNQAPQGFAHHSSSSADFIHGHDHFLKSASSPDFSPQQNSTNLVYHNHITAVADSNISNAIGGVNRDCSKDDKALDHSSNDSTTTLQPPVRENGASLLQNEPQESYLYSNVEIINIVRDAFSSCKANLQVISLNNVERRVSALEAALQSEKLTPLCKLKLCKLVEHLKCHKYKDAYDVHSLMMIDHFAEVNSWMIGLKAIIMEHLKT